MTTKSLGWVLGIIVSIGGVLAVWDRLGWVTIPAYAEEHKNASQQDILKILKEVQAAQAKNQDQWECDETDEELEDIEYHLAEELNPLEIARIARDKKKLEEVWTEKKCSRFTD